MIQDVQGLDLKAKLVLQRILFLSDSWERRDPISGRLARRPAPTPAAPEELAEADAPAHEFGSLGPWHQCERCRRAFLDLEAFPRCTPGVPDFPAGVHKSHHLVLLDDKVWVCIRCGKFCQPIGGRRGGKVIGLRDVCPPTVDRAVPLKGAEVLRRIGRGQLPAHLD